MVFSNFIIPEKARAPLLLTSEVDARRCLPCQTKNVTASQTHDQAAWHLLTAVFPCVGIRRKNKPEPYNCLEICSFTFLSLLSLFFFINEQTHQKDDLV